jgi:hypothetical protein
MFRLIRLPILLCVAFGAGFLYAEITAGERCLARGGTWDQRMCTP